MTTPADTRAFEAFQGRVLGIAAACAAVAAVGAIVAGGGVTPLAAGLALGFAASLAGHALKVRGLRRLGREADRARPSRASLAAVGRLAVYGGALALAGAVPAVNLWAAAGGLFLVNVVTVAVAVVESARPAAEPH